MNALNYTDAMTAEAHTGTTDHVVGITYWQALRWFARSTFLASPTFLLIWLYGTAWLEPFGANRIAAVPTSATQLAVFASALAAAAGMAWLSFVWQKRRHPERYAACMATLTAARKLGSRG